MSSLHPVARALSEVVMSHFTMEAARKRMPLDKKPPASLTPMEREVVPQGISIKLSKELAIVGIPKDSVRPDAWFDWVNQGRKLPTDAMTHTAHAGFFENGHALHVIQPADAPKEFRIYKHDKARTAPAGDWVARVSFGPAQTVVEVRDHQFIQQTTHALFGHLLPKR